MPGRTFTREFKLDLCRQLASGIKRPAQLCREHSLGETILSRWRAEFRERGEEAFTPRQLPASTPEQALEQRVAELERHCGQLSLENALLKKLLTTKAAGNDTK
jgi:transposase-like protein